MGTQFDGPGHIGVITSNGNYCHIKMMTKRGIWNLENLDFSQLLADNVPESLFVWSPLKLKGAAVTAAPFPQ